MFNKTFSIRSLLLAMIFFISAEMKSQLVASYGFNQFSGSYNAITGGTVFGNSTVDDEFFVDPSIPSGGFSTTGPGIPIGFNFSFNGNAFDVIGISNNGWISLGQSTLTPDQIDMSSSSSFDPISSTSSAPILLQNKIAPLACDLEAQTGSEIRVETIGSNPNQTLVVQFTSYRFFGNTGDSFDFQIRLSQSNSHVDIVYGTFTTTNSGTAQVGLRGIPSNDFNNRDVSTSNLWSTSNTGTANTDIVNINSTLTPVSGQDYQWTPPPLCSGTPNSGTASISSATSCPNTNFTLTSTGLSLATGLTYQWQSAPSSSGPWTNISTANNTSYVTSASVTTFYQMVTTCTVSGLTATTSVISFTPVNCVLMNTQTITTCSTTIFDSGGPNNNYQDNENYTLTLVPSTANAMASLNFVSFDTESGYDYLYVYDGNSTSAPLIGQYDGNTLPPAITATNATGILTLKFTSDGSANYTGFEINTSCYTPPPCSGAPNSGTAAVSSATNCMNAGAFVSANGVTTGTGIQYQWYSAPSATGPWTSMSNYTIASFQAFPTNPIFYQMVTTCTNSSMSATTSVVSFTPVNCYIMNNSTITACSSTLYDSGGPSNNYQDDESYTLTIVPATAGSSVNLSFTAFNTESGFDYLSIYDGANTSAPLIGQYDGNTLPPSITATNSAGVLTLLFESDGSVNYAGYEIATSCSLNCSGPPSTITAAGTTVCAGYQTTLTTVATGTAQWHSAATATSVVGTGNSFTTPTLSSNTTYYLRDSTGCGTSSFMPITVSVTPGQTLNVVSSSSAMCSGSSVTLTASGMSSYTWNTTATTAVIVVSPTATTNYSVLAYSSQCDGTQQYSLSLPFYNQPTVSLSAQASTICATTGSISLNGQPSGGIYSGTAVSGSLLDISNAGTYTPVYSYTDNATGCTNSASTSVIVANCLSVKENNDPLQGFTIYPNPNNGSFIINSGSVENSEVVIMDITGKTVLSQTLHLNNNSIDISQLANGIYQLRINSENGTLIRKIIKQ